jgi:molybdopterin synthase sulfur carrier subunit
VAVVSLRPPLRDRAGGASDVEVQGSSLITVLRTLEAEHPRIVGWVLDEHGRIRRHVNVFVNGEMTREDLSLEPGDRVHVVPSITGGC